MNWLVVYMFGLMILVSAIMACGHAAFLATDDRWYIYTTGANHTLTSSYDDNLQGWPIRLKIR